MPDRETAEQQRKSAEHRSVRPAGAIGKEPHARRVVVVGAPEDIPRALEHPAVGAGRFDVLAVLAVEVDAEPHADGVDRLAQLLETHAA